MEKKNDLAKRNSRILERGITNPYINANHIHATH